MEQQVFTEKLIEIQDRLISQHVTTDKRLYLLCESENSLPIVEFLFKTCALRFTIVTCIDAEDSFEMLYHLSNDQTGQVVTVKAFIRDRDNPEIASITPLIPGAEWIEREIHDLYGVRFSGHPNMKRLILADDWPVGDHPLRKEKKHEEVPQ